MVELRQYTLRPGRRDELIDLFEQELLQPQEDTGMRVLGQFRSPSRPELFVWLRGFPDMASRPEMLAAFYGGPVWARHREAANATMVDSDNVVLLNPVSGDDHHPVDPSVPIDGPLVVILQRVRQHDRAEVAPPGDGSSGRAATGGLIATFVSEPSANNFDRLPVRADGPFVAAMSTGDRAVDRVAAEVAHRPGLVAVGDPEVIDLVPTAVSVRRANGRDVSGVGGGET